MSWDINRVIIVGRLTNDVELKYTPSGMAIAKFGIAVGGRPKQDGTDNVSFFNVVVWGKTGENCGTYLSKGKQVALDGRLEQRSWTAQDGSRRSVVEITAERVEFLGAPSGKGAGTSAQGQITESRADLSASDNFYDNTDFNSAPVDPGVVTEGSPPMIRGFDNFQ